MYMSYIYIYIYTHTLNLMNTPHVMTFFISNRLCLRQPRFRAPVRQFHAPEYGFDDNTAPAPEYDHYLYHYYYYYQYYYCYYYYYEYGYRAPAPEYGFDDNTY